MRSSRWITTKSVARIFPEVTSNPTTCDLPRAMRYFRPQTWEISSVPSMTHNAGCFATARIPRGPRSRPDSLNCETFYNRGGRFKGKTIRAHVRRDGTSRLRGKIYKSPSAAGGEVCKRSCNGWWFWKSERAPGDWVRLSVLKG